MKRLIARYETKALGLRAELGNLTRFASSFEDGTPATMEDFARRNLGSIGDPQQVFEDGQEVAVEVGMTIAE